MAKKKSDTQGEMWESAHKIWLAGLGALSAAEEEGEKLFKNLVSRGEKYESRVKEPVEKVRGSVKKARARAGKTFESIESLVDDKVTAVLNRLGVPTRDEIAKLTRRVEELTRAVEAKSGRKKASRRTTKSTGKATKSTAEDTS